MNSADQKANTAARPVSSGAAPATERDALGIPPVPSMADMSRFDLARATAPTVADVGSSIYRFDAFHATSADGKRHYVMRIAIPLKAAPAQGYPAVYLLDGNAAFAAIKPEHLQALADDAALDTPVIVSIGYDTKLGFDVEARAYDYTPPADAPNVTLADDIRNRLGGGADDFLDLIAQKVLPEVQRRVKTDPARQTLWGHSFGGLLSLYTLATRPTMFTRYAAADASMWWHNGYLLEPGLVKSKPPAGLQRQLYMMVGSSAAEVASTEPRPLRRDVDPELAVKARAARRAVPVDAAKQLAERLRELPNLKVTYEDFPGISHGPMLAAGIGPGLKFAAQR